MIATELPAGTPVQKTAVQRTVLLLRFLVPAVVLGYLISVVPLRDTLTSLKSIPLWAFAVSIGIGLAGLLVAALRWQLLFTACGIEQRPSVLRLLSLHLIGFFYNLCVPGGLGGDVVRAVAIRRVMGARGLPGALAMVLLERTLGAAALLILVAATFSLFPLARIENVIMWSGVGLCVAVTAVACIANASRVARFLPAPLAKVAAGLPTVEAPRAFFAALALSIVTQTSVIFIGHILLSRVAPSVQFTESMALMPLVGASQYFPLTIGGAGVREAAFVKLYETVGVSQPDALAASFALAAVMYATAGIGGILQMLNPLTVERT